MGWAVDTEAQIHVRNPVREKCFLMEKMLGVGRGTGLYVYEWELLGVCDGYHA